MIATNGNLGGKSEPGHSRAGRVVAFLGSVKLALFLLSFIALSSVVGTLIKQEASPEEYLARFSPASYTVIHSLGFDDLFHSWWFLLSLLIFALNLVLCTFQRLAYLFRKPSHEKLPKESSLWAMELNFMREGMDVGTATRLLKGYRPVSVTGEGAVLDRGRMARYGVLVIHGSILLILLGGFIGLRFGYRGALTLSVGESKDAVLLRDGSSTSAPLGFTIKCTDFRVAFYDNGQPREFVSSLEIWEGSHLVRRKDIRVNDPLTHKGVSFFQATYGHDPLFRFRIDGRNVELKRGNAYEQGKLLLMVTRYAESVHDFGPGVQVAYLDQGEPKATWFLRDVPRLREQVILGTPVRLDAIHEQVYTGLEVTKDPGLWFVWCGFFFMLCGLYLNFGVYHRRLYLLQTDRGVLIAGTSRKNREGFRREFQRLKEKLHVK